MTAQEAHKFLKKGQGREKMLLNCFKHHINQLIQIIKHSQ